MVEELPKKLQQKIHVLEAFDTKLLMLRLEEYETELEKALTEYSVFENTNHEYIASGQDCGAVKKNLAELYVIAPGKNQAEREAWLVKQRQENKALSDAIARQREVSFLLDDYKIKLDMAKRRFERTKAVLALRTAQIKFLASEE